MTGRTIRAVAVVLAIVLAGCEAATASPSPQPTASPVATQPPSPTPLACASGSTDGPAAGDLPWWSDRVFYEVFVRSFADSDGDGVGDLRGLTDRLDYLNDGDPATTEDLGVTGIWLMPVAEAASYHGYDVVDYEAIERDYGTTEDFSAFLAAAHERGIAVIVDFVINHTSIEHPWFEASRTGDETYADWYVWSAEHGGFGGPGGRQVWHQDGDRFYYAYFWEGMPDLDLSNPEVTEEINRISRYWLEDLGIDGYRLDAARHLIEDGEQLENTPATRAWLNAFRADAHALNDEALVLGEVWDATSNSARYVRDGSLDLAFEFGLASAFVSAVRFSDPASLALIQAEVSAAYPPGGYAAFLTNHDQDRVFDQVGRDVSAAKAAATLLLTSAGVPFVYYGEEVGLRGRKPDERIRTPMPWTARLPGVGFTSGEPWQAPADGSDTANVADQTADPTSLLAHYRRLITLRSQSDALRYGEVVPVGTETDGIYAILRHAAGETVAVVVNLGDEPASGPTLSLAAGPLCGEPAVTMLDAAAGRTASAVEAPMVNATGGFDAWQPVPSLGPRESLVLRIDR